MTGRRVLTALVALPALYVVIRYLPPSAFVLLVGVAALIGQYELYRMGGAAERPVALASGLGAGLLILCFLRFLMWT